MPGVDLSRWTMLYFVLALAALITAEVLMAAGFGYPAAPLQDPHTLVLVHLVVLGWLSLLLCGALFQFVPVLVARPLYSNMLPLPALIFLVAGLCFLLCGFLQLGGTGDGWPWLLPFAATSLAIGFTLVLYNLGRTLWTGRPLPLPARFVAVALGFLAATALLGGIFSFAFAVPLSSTALLAIAGAGLPLHVVAGIGGWLTFTAIGVSYRLLAMFMLAPELEGVRPRAVFWLGTLGLLAVVAGGLVLVLSNASLVPALIAGGILGAVALALYGADMLRLYRARKRPIIELNSQMAALALISLAGCVILAVVLIGLGAFTEQVGAVVFLAVFGWLSGLGLAKLYKIVAFLTWLECYGPVLGRTVTPRVQDLVVEPGARKWFGLYFVAVWGGAIALLAASPVAFRLAAAAMAVATLAITLELARTRLLSNVLAKSSLPAGARRPRFLVSAPGAKS